MSVSAELGELKQVDLAQGTVRYRERGTGEPIVFVHGLLVNGDLWRKVVPPLAERYRCITPDLPLGSHEPPLAANADLSPPGVARLIHDFMERLELRDVTLVGNDTGGAFCQLVAVEHPQRIGRLVLTPCDSYDNFLPPAFKYLQLTARLPGSMFLLAQTLRLRFLHHTPLVFGLLAKRPVDRGAMDSYGAAVKRNAGVRRDLRKVLKGISKRYTVEAGERLRDFRRPALIAWAREDRVFPFEHGVRLAETMPNAVLEPIDDSYSFVPEDQPARLAELIAEFARFGAPAGAPASA
jgi:pimeloyl-ACP methyl ester carboxylesterase